MNPIVLIIIVLVVAESIVDIVRICANTISQRRNLKQENESLKSELSALNRIILNQKTELFAYKYRANNTNNTVYDNDVKEAVKYAMKKAHPDNDGNNEEFSKFRELYNKIK